MGVALPSVGTIFNGLAGGHFPFSRCFPDRLRLVSVLGPLIGRATKLLRSAARIASGHCHGVMSAMGRQLNNVRSTVRQFSDRRCPQVSEL